MRKLRVFESISIDGYFTDGSGDLNAAREDVASSTLAPTWQNTTALRDLVPGVRALEADAGPGITVLGSVAAQLGEAGLVDEYQFVIVPVALGRGRTVLAARRALALVGQRAFDNGNVVVTYAAA